MRPQAPLQTPHHDGDGWLECACGSKHWGLYGAAGLFLVRRGTSPTHSEVMLQHRALWSHFGGTWGIPGGALENQETPLAGAIREASEETGTQASDLEVFDTFTLDHGTWAYTTVLAFLKPEANFSPSPTDAESLAVSWVPLAKVETLPLLPAFLNAWPELKQRTVPRIGTCPP